MLSSVDESNAGGNSDWLEVKGLALPEFMIEIELEARAPHRTIPA